MPHGSSRTHARVRHGVHGRYPVTASCLPPQLYRPAPLDRISSGPKRRHPAPTGYRKDSSDSAAPSGPEPHPVLPHRNSFSAPTPPPIGGLLSARANSNRGRRGCRPQPHARRRKGERRGGSRAREGRGGQPLPPSEFSGGAGRQKYGDAVSRAARQYRRSAMSRRAQPSVPGGLHGRRRALGRAARGTRAVSAQRGGSHLPLAHG